jgi:hypothetical protein
MKPIVETIKIAIILIVNKRNLKLECLHANARVVL